MRARVAVKPPPALPAIVPESRARQFYEEANRRRIGLHDVLQRCPLAGLERVPEHRGAKRLT